MTGQFTFSDVVNRYLTDPKVQSAVGQLTNGRMPTSLDPEFSWNEFPGYLDAWLAAQQVAVEWARMLHQLWDAVWDGHQGIKFTYFDRSKPLPSGLADGGLGAAWHEDWYGRHIQLRDKSVVHLVVFCTQSEAWLQVEFPHESEQKQFLNWNRERNWWNSAKFDLKVKEGSRYLELKPMREQAQAALVELGLMPQP